MSPATASLFTPLRIRHLDIPNRVAMAPMTRGFSPGGVPGADVAAYYRRRAEHGVGLIITEGTVVDHPASSSNPNVPRFFGGDALAGWAQVVEGVHAAGGRILPQLWHVGLMRRIGDLPNPGAMPVGPSGLARPGERVTQPMSEDDIRAIVEAFGRAAADARRLGFDGIELHGAHGYLIDQFFWAGTNERHDNYGGDLVRRTRFAADVIAACRRATSPDFPIVLRFSQWKIQDVHARLVETPGALAQFLEPLVAAGVDLFHCSTRRFWEPEFAGSELTLAGWTRQITGRPVITVGSVGLAEDFAATLTGNRTVAPAHLDRLIGMLDRGEVDLVAVGRTLLGDPEWAAKIRDGRFDALQPFSPEAKKTLV